MFLYPTLVVYMGILQFDSVLYFVDTFGRFYAFIDTFWAYNTLRNSS